MQGFLIRARARFEWQTSSSNLQIAANYRGFDGDAWPLEDSLCEAFLTKDGLIALADESVAYEYYLKTLQKMPCDCLYLSAGEDLSASVPITSRTMLFCGYDFGNYISRYNYFSIIFNEILFSHYAEMLRFKRYLNSHILLSDKMLISEIIEARNRLQLQQMDIETEEHGEEFEPIAVFSLVDSDL